MDKALGKERRKEVFPPDSELKPVGTKSGRVNKQSVSLFHDDCLNKMRSMATNSCDSIVTDTVFGIGARGLDWDKELPSYEYFCEMLRIVRPGSHAAFFGHDKTYHLLVPNLIAAGWEFVQNFPYVKHHGEPLKHQYLGNKLRTKGYSGEGYDRALNGVRCVYDPIVVARKPRDPDCATWADNIIAWGVGCMLTDELTPPGPQERIFLPNNGKVDARSTYRTRSADNLLDFCEDAADSCGDLPFLLLNEAERKDFHREQRDKTKVGHPFKKPVQICERLVRLVTPPGGLVFDPYAGQAPVGVACINTGRSYIGCDIDLGHVEAGKERLAKADAARGKAASFEPIPTPTDIRNNAVSNDYAAKADAVFAKFDPDWFAQPIEANEDIAPAEPAKSKNNKTVRQKSFLKWAGGKRSLIDKIEASFPLKGKRLIEPFVGAGNVFLNSDFQSYLLYDANRDLIDVFNHLKYEGDKLISIIEKLFSEGHGTEKVFISRRYRFNRCRPGIWRSALFVYLNRNCFNGVCRYNASDEKLNVAWSRTGGKCPSAELRAFQAKTNSVDCEFVCADFAKAFERAERGDAIYVDPPYLPLDGAKSNFTGYQGTGFDEEDHLCLASLCINARDTGCRVAVSNHDCRVARLIYGDADEIVSLTTRGTVAGQSAARKPRREILAIYRPTPDGDRTRKVEPTDCITLGAHSEVTLHRGDCLEVMRNKSISGDALYRIPSSSVNLILTDLPYGVTQNAWDHIIDPTKLWPEFERVLARNGCVILTATQPFASKLILSNSKMFKYDLIWSKTIASGQLNVKRQPLRTHEHILIFYNKPPTYNEQKTIGQPYKISRKTNYENNNYGAQTDNSKENEGYRHAKSVLTISNPRIRGAHPTQKPNELLANLIKTYSNEGDIVLDCCMGSGSTGVAAISAKRCFIGIENNESYFQMALANIKNCISRTYIGDDSNDRYGDEPCKADPRSCNTSPSALKTRDASIWAESDWERR